jgi:Protein of unknown function (DUF433)
MARDRSVLCDCGSGPSRLPGRVSFQALLDYLEGGDTLDEFLDEFPTVTREAAVSALELAKSLLSASWHGGSSRRMYSAKLRRAGPVTNVRLCRKRALRVRRYLARNVGSISRAICSHYRQTDC